MSPLPPGLHFVLAPSERFPASANMVACETPGGLVLIDSGGSGATNHRTTTEALASLGHVPGDVTRVLLTHAHADHSGGLSLLPKGTPVALHSDAHPMANDSKVFFATFGFDLIRERYPRGHPSLDRAESFERYLAEGDCPFEPFTPTQEMPRELELGGVRFVTVDGGGHALGHVMFHAPEAKLLIAGDLVGHQLAWHSPQSGGPAAYLDSLERAHALDVATVWPAHGPPIADARGQIEKLRDKLLKREDKLLQALKSKGTLGFPALVLIMIGADDDQDVALFPAVPMLEGHLQRLEAQGLVSRSGAQVTAQY